MKRISLIYFLFCFLTIADSCKKENQPPICTITHPPSGYTVSRGENIDVSAVENADFLGLGLIKVSKVLYNKPEPTQGIIELVKGDISTDIAFYFTQSEQIPTSLILDVALDEKGNITNSGGIMIQALPGATEEDLEEVVNNV